MKKNPSTVFQHDRRIRSHTKVETMLCQHSNSTF